MKYDIIVVGGGHAGIEAAYIASKKNLKIEENGEFQNENLMNKKELVGFVTNKLFFLKN